MREKPTQQRQRPRQRVRPCQRPQQRLRLLHRLHAALTITVLITLLTLRIIGVLSSADALRLFLVIELPLLAVFVAISVARFRSLAKRKNGDQVRFLDRLVAEEPLLKPAVTELRVFASLGLLIFGVKRIPPGAKPFGYTRGTLLIPSVFVALSLGELLLVHLLVPWLWLQLVLLVLTLWGVLFVLGLVAARVVHPHSVTVETLQLQWGYQTVLATPLTNIAAVSLYANHQHTHPAVAGDSLILTQFQSTNLRIQFIEAVESTSPVAKRHQPSTVQVREALLYVADPKALLQELQGAIIPGDNQ